MAKSKSKTAKTVPNSPCSSSPPSPRKHGAGSSSYEDLTKFDNEVSKNLEETSKKLLETNDSSLASAHIYKQKGSSLEQDFSEYLPKSRRYFQGSELFKGVEKKISSNEDINAKSKNHEHRRKDSTVKKPPLNQLTEENKIFESGPVNLNTRNKKSPATEKNKEIRDNKEIQKDIIKEEKVYDISGDDKNYASGPVKTFYSQTKKQLIPEKSVQGNNSKEESSADIVEETKLPVTKNTNFGQKVKNKLSLEKNKESSENSFREERSPSIFSFPSTSSSKKSLIPEIKNKNLIKAIKENNIKELKKWLSTKPNVNYQELNSGDTPLSIAMKLGKYEIVKILLEAGADPKIPNRASECPFDKINDNLISAAIEGKLKDCEILLQLGADVNYQEEINNNTALHYAIGKKNYPLVSALITAGADLKKLNLLEKTPVDNLSEENQIIFMLLSQDIKNSNQQVMNRIDSIVADNNERAQDSKTITESTKNFKKLESAKQSTNLDKNFVDEFNEKFAKQRQDVNIENKKTSQDIHDLQQAFKIYNNDRIKQQQNIDSFVLKIADLEEAKTEQEKQTYQLKTSVATLTRKTELTERTNKKLDLQNKELKVENQKLCKLLEERLKSIEEVRMLEEKYKKDTEALDEWITDDEGSVIKTRPINIEKVITHTGHTYVNLPEDIQVDHIGETGDYSKDVH